MACAASGIRSASACDQDDGGDHGGSLGRRTARRRRRLSPRSHAATGRARSARTSRQPAAAPRRRRPRPARRTRAGCRPSSSQRCSSPTSSAGAPRSGPAPGQHGLAPRRPARRRTGIGATPRRATPGRGQPAVPHDGQLPAAGPSGPGADQLGQRGQRGEPLRRAPARDEAGQPVAAAAPRPRSARRRPASRPRPRSVRSAVVVAALDQAPGRPSTAGAYSAAVCSPAHGAPHRPISGSAHGGAVGAAGRDALGARPQRDGVVQRVDGGGGGAPGPERARGRAPSRRRADDRQPRERLVGELTHQRAVREAGSAGCSGGWCAAISRSSRTSASSGVRAHDVSTRSASADHLAHPAAALAGGEVGAHPAAQVAARADVEHLVARPAEQVDARAPTARPSARCALAPLLRAGRARAGSASSSSRRLHAEVADPLEQAVQDVDGGPGVGERAVVGSGGRAGRAAPARRAARWAPRRGESTARASRAVSTHRRTRPRRAVPLRTPRAGTRRRTARCGRPARRRAANSRKRGQHRLDAAARRRPSRSVMPVSTTIYGGIGRRRGRPASRTRRAPRRRAP